MSKTKLFLKAFAITFAIMSAVGILVLADIPDLSVPKKNTSSHAPMRQYTPTAEDKFTVLLTLTTKPDKSPYAYFLLTLDGMDQSLNITRLPAQTRLSKDGERKIILSEQFEKGASPLALRALSQYFNSEITRYIAIDNSSLTSLFLLFEPTEITVPQNLSQVDEQNEIYIKIDKGRQLLSASSMVDFIAATNWNGGQTQTLFESANAIAAFLNQNGDSLFENSSCALESFILNRSVNNFSVLDFEKHRELIRYVLGTKTAAKSVVVYGQNSMADTEFVLDQNSRDKICKSLKKTVENG